MPEYLPTNMSALVPIWVTVFLIVFLAGVGRVPFSYNVRNLFVRWKTTAVVVLAFTCVIALLVVMLAFVNGMVQLTKTTGNPGNVMILAEGATDEVISNLPSNFSVEELPSDIKRHIRRTDKGEFLVSQEVYVLVSQKVKNKTPGGPNYRFLQMRGLRDIGIAVAVHDMELLRGEWLSPSGVRRVPSSGGGEGVPYKEIVVGQGIAGVIGNDYFGRPLEPGDLVEIGPYEWVVVGVMASGGSTFGSEIWGRDTHVGSTFGKENSYSVFVGRTPNEPIAKAAVKLLKETKLGNIAVQAYTERQYYERLDQTNKQFSVAIYFVAVVMAIGGVLGVMNTMFAAISQRSRDIGVLRLLGYTRGQVLISFLLESLVIAFAGGLLGCAIGALAHGWTASSVISAGPGGGGKLVVLKLIVDGNILATALTFTLVMGFIGGLFPALSAMRLRPLESLR